MLIFGPDGLGDAIDTYVHPLVYELKELWEVGIVTNDASTKQKKLWVLLYYEASMTFKHMKIYRDGVQK